MVDNAKAEGRHVTSYDLAEWAQRMVENVLPAEARHEVDVDQLVREIEADYNVLVGDWNALSDDADHLPWLEEWLKENPDRPFWDRYARFLKQDQRLPSAAVTRLNEATDDILGRLEDPRRDGAWDRRGLVAGQVQSGKTGNYAGLIAKAIDSGYKLVLVLAGVHNSLRSQTQARIDEGILGFDTRAIMVASKALAANRIGVGLLAGPRLYVNSFTSSAEVGDFRLNVARNMGVAPGGADPIILVVKKNKSILTNLYQWATHLTKEVDPETGKHRVRGVPVLVIDDEADHASVNTKGSGTDSEETDPSVINGLIRQFLDTFEMTSYVGYTATPFANIFIDPEATHSTAGSDLFPRSFIVNLPAPSNYIGPERVFGLKEDSANGIDEVPPLPIVRHIEDHTQWIPNRHTASDLPGENLPESLQDAVTAFLLGGAVRRLRAQGNKHHSMLIHVTRFTAVQQRVGEQVQDLLEDIRLRLEFGEGVERSLYDRARRLYDDDFRPTTHALSALPELRASVGTAPSFEEVWGEMPAVATRTSVRVVNGRSEDALAYIDNPDGLSVIAIGGDKLSRGLTLEGLSVSYYLRASRMYDTLMQMGRWFGYRPGYLDLCRLYTTEALVTWYERITAASAELQREFEAMSAIGSTPEQFGLRVRQHPDGLLVTSPAKLRNAQKLSISFSGSSAETVTFKGADRSVNFRALEGLVTRMGSHVPSTPGTRIWRGVPTDDITAFLQGYRADRSAIKVQPKALTSYISARVADSELTHWTVVLGDVSTGPPHRIGGLDIGLTHRRHLNPKKGSGRYAIRRVVSPTHELVDLPNTSPLWHPALSQTIASWNVNPRRKPGDEQPDRPSGLWERRSRPADRGLLLLYPLDPTAWEEYDGDPTPFVGFAASFPWSERAEPIEYQVNLVELKREFGWDDEDLESD